MSEQQNVLVAASAATAAAEIIAKFDGQNALSRELKRLGYNVSQSTVHAWSKNTIPERYRWILLTIAKREGIPHTPADYVRYLEQFA